MVEGGDGGRQHRKEKNGHEDVEELAAADGDRKLKHIKNFGGIIRLSQLKNLKIISYPVGLLVHGYDHWIGLFVSENRVEIMDSSGVLSSKDIASSLRKFLCAQFYRKSFLCTPILQPHASKICGYYSVLFLYLRLKHNVSIEKFSSMFSGDLHNNDKIVLDLFNYL